MNLLVPYLLICHVHDYFRCNMLLHQETKIEKI